MKILVTGAKGMIGSHLVTALLSEGYEVVGVDRAGEDSRSKMLSFFKADLADREGLCRIMEENGVDRVILGTAAVNDPDFLKEAIDKYGERIAVGVDIKDGFVAIKGWLETSNHNCFDFCEKMQNLGVKTIICTDISKDGAMLGTNRALYKELSEKFNVDIVASGGVSNIEDIKALRELNIYGAIIGKAYYIGAINLEDALEAAK